MSRESIVTSRRAILALFAGLAGCASGGSTTRSEPRTTSDRTARPSSPPTGSTDRSPRNESVENGRPSPNGSSDQTQRPTAASETPSVVRTFTSPVRFPDDLDVVPDNWVWKRSIRWREAGRDRVRTHAFDAPV